ncbi:META domain-containing protein [Flavobacterium antarcticum]|uniref:META domain-containing protein n=1 Tax=Flavobacterium antarcticum TaxID=271155 RepID=UPI0003B70A2D|nr:META domain-containing protein [Flavobacterium antarcticum]
MNLKTIGILVTIVLLQACGTKKNTHTANKIFWVSGYKTECDAGAGKGECLLVTTDSDLAEAKWENFYATIEGFSFEEGFMQKIEVKVKDVSNTKIAADQSSLTYTLVKALDKTKDTRIALQGDWTLNKIRGVVLKESDEIPHVNIDLTKNRFSGNNGCNSFSGVIYNVTSDKLLFENTSTTLRDCMDMPLTDAFDIAVKDIYVYQVEHNILSFCNKANEEVLSFTKKSLSTPDMRIHDIYVAVKIRGEAIGQREEMPRFEINLNTMEIFGNNGCNAFNGKITSVTERNITFGGMAMTRMMCQDMVLPGKFDQALQQTASYKFEDLHFTMFDKDGKELITFLKVD